MQEKLLEKKYISPDLRALDKIRRDIQLFGYCLDATKKQIIDEEKTQAAEILATRNYDADIPRHYKVMDNDLVDDYGVSLKNVLENGIEYLGEDSYRNMGREWELRRRIIEKANLEKIIASPEGVACIEISSTDLTRSKAQLLEQGYTGDTLLRISYKNEGNVFQKNIIIKTSDIKMLNKLRKHIDSGASILNSSEEMLKDVLYLSVVPDKFENFCTGIKNFVTADFQSKSPAKFLASIIRRSKQKNRDAWDIVDSCGDIFDEMFVKIEEIAKSKNKNDNYINIIRAGCWQALIDGARKDNEHLVNIDSGVAKAMAIGSVFTSCGGTVSLAAEINYSGSFSFFDRYETVKNLFNKTHSIGICRSCGSPSMMYGCGVYCSPCNRIWCNAYLRTGKQLSDKEVNQAKYITYFRF